MRNASRLPAEYVGHESDLLHRDTFPVECRAQCEVWFRLTYERTYLPERSLYRDKLVHSEIAS